MTLEVHPFIGYVRNVVEEAVLDGSPRWDGVVTEDAEHAAHIVSARHLFGGVRRMVPNMIRVGLHVSSFLDMRSIRNLPGRGARALTGPGPRSFASSPDRRRMRHVTS